tara:strand:- start:240 stop:452 length:213 start_codon:yes stop_codon:yes gene_type:complete
LSQARRILTGGNFVQMQGFTFTQYELDETVKAVVSVINEDREEISFEFNTEIRILNVRGQHTILYLIIEK